MNSFCRPVVALASLAMALPAFAAVTPKFDGTWKLNEAKSQMTGSTYTIAKEGDMYKVSTGAIQFKFALDGKDYPVIADATTACTGTMKKATCVEKVAGKVMSTTTRTLSADGQTESDVTTGTRPDGTKYTDRETYQRVSGDAASMVGTWKNVKSTNSAPSLIMLKVNGDTLHYENVSYKETADGKLDGTLAPITGPDTPQGLMISNTAEGEDKIKGVVTLNGKELGTDIMTVSADGKTITDVAWSAGKEDEKQTYVYDKQ